MKKRILAVLLAVVLCVGVMPVTVFAGGGRGFSARTYQELLSEIARAEASDEFVPEIYILPDEDFGWPDSAELTVPKGISFAVGTSWEIPSGVTLKFEKNSKGITGSSGTYRGELIINGTIVTSYYSQDQVLRCEKVVIGPTGTFVCDDASDPSCHVYIAEEQTWEVQEGATLNADVRLDGTLTGAGTVSGRVTIQGGFMGESAHGTLSGTLTMTNYIRLGQYSGDYDDSLTIPAGSHIKFESQDQDITFYTGGKLVLDGGTISMRYPYSINCPSDDSGNNVVPDSPYISGSGTINLQNPNNDHYRLLRNEVEDIVKHRDEYAAYIDPGVTINYKTAPAFTDVPGWCADPVAWAVGKEITNGTGDNKFSPHDDCKHAEILTFLWRAADKPASDAALPVDIAGKNVDWAADALRWAAEKGMVDGSLDPTARCTRAEAVTYIWEALGGTEVDGERTFSDVPAGADYARAVAWAAARGVTNGYEDGTFGPNKTCSRGEIVTFLYRACQ